MEGRWTRWPGGRRRETVELIVETVPRHARSRLSRRRDEESVGVRIGYAEVELREHAKRLGVSERVARD